MLAKVKTRIKVYPHPNLHSEYVFGASTLVPAAFFQSVRQVEKEVSLFQIHLIIQLRNFHLTLIGSD